jgi:hypothetical protein
LSLFQACLLAQSLSLKAELLHIFNMQAVCHEKLGAIADALKSAQKMIAIDAASPKGYLRVGKLLRQQRRAEDALHIYALGLKEADKTNQFYSEIQKQYQTVLGKAEQMTGKAEPNLNVQPGHLLSLPLTIFHRVFATLSAHELQTLSFTNSKMRALAFEAYYRGCIGNIVPLSQIGTVSGLSRLQEQLHIFDSPIRELSLRYDSSSKAFFSLMREHLKKHPGKLPKIAGLCFGTLHADQIGKLLECFHLGMAKHLKRLSLATTGESPQLTSLIQYLLSRCKLQFLEIRSISDRPVVIEAGPLEVRFPDSLQTLILSGVNYSHALQSLIVQSKALRALVFGEKGLDLSSARGLRSLATTVSAFQALSSLPPRLSRLDLDAGLEEVSPAIWSRLTSISSLSIRRLRSVTYTELSPIHWQGLRVLRLENVAFSGNPVDFLSQIFQGAGNLAMLELKDVNVDNVSVPSERGTGVIKSLLRHQPSLEHLILHSLALGPDALTCLMKALQTRQLPLLKVLGLVEIDSQMAVAHENALIRLYRAHYPHSYLITAPSQYQEYRKLMRDAW